MYQCRLYNMIVRRFVPRVKIVLKVCCVAALFFFAVPTNWKETTTRREGPAPIVSQQLSSTKWLQQGYLTLALQLRHYQTLVRVADKAGLVRKGPDPDFAPGCKLIWTWNTERVQKEKIRLARHRGQKVNFMPGIEVITNKASLSDLGILPGFIPLALTKYEAIMQFARANPDKIILKKSLPHREVIAMRAKEILSLPMRRSRGLIQELIENPLLIDGHKFDIALHLVITSVDPLRLYMYDNFLVRFCQDKYHPFDPNNTRKYVISDREQARNEDVATWFRLLSLGLSPKEAMGEIWRSLGGDPREILDRLASNFGTLFTAVETKLMDALKSQANSNSSRTFFQHFRADLMMDSDLNWRLIEINGFPNIDTHMESEEKRKEYNSLIHSILKLTGTLNGLLHRDHSVDRDHSLLTPDHVYGDQVAQECLAGNGALFQVKEGCPEDQVGFLRDSAAEHMARGHFLRVLPRPPGTQVQAQVMLNKWDEEKNNDTTLNNIILTQWFWRKCLEEQKWCLP